MEKNAGSIILVNGTSSAGKSTLCRALRNTLPLPFWHFSSDQLIIANMRPDERIAAKDFSWHEMRPHFFDGFHRMIPAFAAAGNNLLVEHIVEEKEWATTLFASLENFDVFIVSVRSSKETMVKREKARQDVTEGEALYHMKTYDYIEHDVEVDGSVDADTNAIWITKLWGNR